MTEKKRIGILTGGGDCPGLNAVIRAACLTCLSNNYELVGLHDGYEGSPPCISFNYLRSIFIYY
jgi:6-phosphofructokinase